MSVWSKAVVTQCKFISVILGLSYVIAIAITNGEMRVSAEIVAGETQPGTALPTARLQDPGMSTHLHPSPSTSRTCNNDTLTVVQVAALTMHACCIPVATLPKYLCHQFEEEKK